MGRLAILIFLIGNTLGAQVGKPPNPTVFSGLPEKTSKSDLRALHGQILDTADNPLEKSVVYLKNIRTLRIITFITGKDGSYHFNGLSTSVDYEVRAEHLNAFSATRTLSLLDGRKDVSLNLRIDEKNKKPDDKKKPDEAAPDEKKKPGV
jgi:hypothetical protein